MEVAQAKGRPPRSRYSGAYGDHRRAWVLTERPANHKKDIVATARRYQEADLVEAKEDKEAVMLELEQLANYKAELHSSCDFVMKNFEIRQTARDEEIEALKQAKAILSGAKFEAFLQGA